MLTTFRRIKAGKNDNSTIEGGHIMGWYIVEISVCHNVQLYKIGASKISTRKVKYIVLSWGNDKRTLFMADIIYGYKEAVRGKKTCSLKPSYRKVFLELEMYNFFYFFLLFTVFFFIKHIIRDNSRKKNQEFQIAVRFRPFYPSVASPSP